MEHTASIVEWNYEKGYGILQHNSGRIFLHIRDFSRRGKQPKVGEVIRFKMGRDIHGRECAVDAAHPLPSSRLTLASLFFLALLLILPMLALRRLAPDPRVL